MKLKIKYLLSIFSLLVFTSFMETLARNIEVIDCIDNENRVLNEAVDLHLTNATAPLKNNGTVNLSSEESWLYFDNVKPSIVLQKYKSFILINGEPLDPTKNARISIYMNGAVVIPHAPGYQPLEAFTEKDFGGTSAKYSLDMYYTNKPSSDVPTDMLLPLSQDNNIRSFRLKKGYMATFANDPNGLGYSRIFFADKEDLIITEIPLLLDKKVSFIRVFNWEFVSKKGWVGSVDNGQTNGSKYVEEQCDKTNSTWYYNWSPSIGWSHNPATITPNYNQEFCPEKWGYGGSSDWQNIFSIKKASHLLGYNEPDHTEQSNVSVEKAVEEWPKMLQTGMRVGSPAATNFSWLYSFLEQCNKKNYRVDYVAIHAYWGGLDPSAWYNDLKTIHDRTGRPLWITEWNNGANWTKEGWPTGTTAQQEKQMNDLKGILMVLDTAHFIERYSIYNWVEDKRALLLNGQLTPAGEYYAADPSALAFDRVNEVIPTWTVREAPILSYSGFSEESGEISLSWTDYNNEMIASYIIERGTNQIDFSEVARIDTLVNTYSDPLASVNGPVYYRVKSIDFGGKIKISNVIKYEYLKNEKDGVAVGKLVAPTDWTLCALDQAYTENPIVVFGAPSYRNKTPMSFRVNNLKQKSFEFKFETWEYLQNPTFVNQDTISYMVLTKGIHDFGGITVQAGNVSDVSISWKLITFDTPFNEVPVVFGTQVTNNNLPITSVRVRNVTKEGFELALQYEAAITPGTVGESVCYVAMTPGTGSYNGKIVKVGRTATALAGDYLTGMAKIEYGASYTTPAFFGFMQTESDGIASCLRVKTSAATYAEVFKEREKSQASTAVTKEVIGWMVVETKDTTTGTKSTQTDAVDEVIFNSDTNKISLSSSSLISQATVYSLLGEKLISRTSVYDLDVSELNSGIYIVNINGDINLKITKE
ncbi:MAG: glycosyl hydrolase [Bacteroidales bacterium]|nr:glycosyl hydrolase [Bacteroidales bacterium]MDD4822291.1 glycosyl hydrolase [Bacteroidales bacterium]